MGHALEWEFDNDDVYAKVVCTEPPEANCHYVPDCECETYTELLRDEQGPFHWYEWTDYTEDHRFIDHKERHGGKWDATECNAKNWLEADSPIECAERGTRFLLATTPIELVWNGDFYEWKPVS